MVYKIRKIRDSKPKGEWPIYIFAWTVKNIRILADKDECLQNLIMRKIVQIDDSDVDIRIVDRFGNTVVPDNGDDYFVYFESFIPGRIVPELLSRFVDRATFRKIFHSCRDYLKYDRIRSKRRKLWKRKRLSSNTMTTETESSSSRR